ncbi:MAG: serine/threonine protein kinase [Steroidobacteraceae bacterium]
MGSGKQANFHNYAIDRPVLRRPSFPTIPGYRFIQPIANSQQACVYLAYSIELDQDIAIKVLGNANKRDLSAAQVQRFERERELLLRVRHRSVVDLYDWGQMDQLYYLVTEYFSAGSVELRIRNLMSVHDCVDIFLQIAGALVAIHRTGLCHRDLKPANVMLRADSSVVLIDFGLAITLDSIDLTKIGEVHGSPYYISPEQVDGSSQGDHRSDLYALGVMFYEMLTGTRPFQGKTIIAIAQAHKNEPIPILPTSLAQFQPVINRLLEKDPDKRLQSAADALSMIAKLKV